MAHIDEFGRFLIEGGQVSPVGLSSLLRRAPLLGVCRDGDELVGFAGLKLPRESYVARIFANADCEQRAMEYKWELGWAYTRLTHRGQRVCPELFRRILSDAPEGKIYATTESTPDPAKGMRKILPKFGFSTIGIPYRSSDGKRLIELYVRQA